MIEKVMSSFREVSDEQISVVAERLLAINQSGRKVWVVGNGGSSATASHFTSDLANLGFDVVCLTDNVPRLTALTNDYGWDEVYFRMLAYRFKTGDCLIIFTVNGSVGKSQGGTDWSANLYKAARLVRFQPGSKDNTIVLFSGNDGGDIIKQASLHLTISSKDPYVVEGIHSVLAHLVCESIKEMRE